MERSGNNACIPAGGKSKFESPMRPAGSSAAHAGSGLKQKRTVSMNDTRKETNLDGSQSSVVSSEDEKVVRVSRENRSSGKRRSSRGSQNAQSVGAGKDPDAEKASLGVQRVRKSSLSSSLRHSISDEPSGNGGFSVEGSSVRKTSYNRSLRKSSMHRLRSMRHMSKVMQGIDDQHRPSTPVRSNVTVPSMTITSLVRGIVEKGSIRMDHEGATASTGKEMVLPRGGVLVETKQGPLQFGIPPETIKDHMSMGATVPQMYVVPFQRFNKVMAVNVAEFEFPAYFNFFVLRKRIKLICTKESEKHIRSVFQETLLGPKFEELIKANVRDYSSEVPRHARADLVREMKVFAVNPFEKSQELTVDLLLDFVVFDGDKKDGKVAGDLTVSLGNGVTVSMVIESPEDNGKGQPVISYLVEEDGAVIAHVPDEVQLPSISDKVTRSPNDWIKRIPAFGVTFMGTSHGFDPAGSTTGFVLWLHGRGILVDPPPHSSSLLTMMGVPPWLVDTVILTHCHADHDAGAFQKLLQEEQVTLITTRTIMGSFLRKYSALAGFQEVVLRNLFNFQPARIGADILFRGAKIRFFYSLHTIPCIGFQAMFRGKSIVYSSDTLNDPTRIEQMCRDEVMTEGRRDALLAFPWDSDLILHEAGVPPIHTPMDFLASLDADVKKRMLLVHTNEKAVPKGKGLRLAAEGAWNTVEIDVEPSPSDTAVGVFDALNNVPQLSNLPISMAADALRTGRVVEVGPSETLDTMGDGQDIFFVVLRGGATVHPPTFEDDATVGGDVSAGGGSIIDATSGEEGRSGRPYTQSSTSDDVQGDTDLGLGSETASSRISSREFVFLQGKDTEVPSIHLERWDYFPPSNFWGTQRLHTGQFRTHAQRCPHSKVTGCKHDGARLLVYSLAGLNALLQSQSESLEAHEDFVGDLASDAMTNIGSFLDSLSEKMSLGLGTAQQSEMHKMMMPCKFAAKEALWLPGSCALMAFIVEEGDCAMKANADGAMFQKCPALSFALDPSYWKGDARNAFGLYAETAVKGYMITCNDLRQFAHRYPKLLLKIREEYGEVEPSKLDLGGQLSSRDLVAKTKSSKREYSKSLDSTAEESALEGAGGAGGSETPGSAET